MVLYMAVTPDELELPVAVADTVAELARMVKTKPKLIYSSINHKCSGKTRGIKFVRVSNDD